MEMNCIDLLESIKLNEALLAIKLKCNIGTFDKFLLVF